MQKIDAYPNGYTAAEILSQLEFGTGSREMTFRYDLYDYTNTYLQPLTNVVSCSIHNGFLDDIKRKAQFEFTEDGSINYISNRVKPWVQVQMPDDGRSYSQVVSAYGAVDSWNFNETSGATAVDSIGGLNGAKGTAVTGGTSGIAEGSAYSFNGGTAASAYVGVPNGLANVTGQTGYTLAVWARVKSAAAMNIITTANGSLTLGLLLSGAVTFSHVNANNTVGVTGNVTQVPLGSALIVVRWLEGSYPVISINGVTVVNAVTTGADVITLPAFAGTTLQVGNGFTGDLDDLSLYASYLPDSEVLNLYRAGVKTGPFGSKNYAEWPQGVFLLSSTERDNDENGVVTRNVDGYDQLQVYTDDKVLNRYTAMAGQLYTNVIISLIQGSIPTTLQRLNTNYDWSATSGSISSVDQASASVNGPTSATGSPGQLFTTQNYTIQDLVFTSNMTTPATGAGHRVVSQLFELDANNYVGIIWTGASGTGTLTFRMRVAGVNTDVSVTYSATTHAFWQIVESAGTVYWQTSPDGVTWTTQATQNTPFGYLQPAFATFVATATGTESAWSVTIPAATTIASVVAYLGPTMRRVSIIPTFTASASTITVSKDYDPGTSKLAIINDLLAAINYVSLAFDPNGYPVVQPYVIPASRASEFTYADNSQSVILPQLNEQLDLFDIPNIWVLVVSNPDQTALVSTYTNNNPASITSTIARGRNIVYYETEQDSPDQPTLDARAKQMANDASQIYDTVTFYSAIMPFHDDNDVMMLNYTELGITDKISETEWSYDLAQGAQMTHVVRRQVQLI